MLSYIVRSIPNLFTLGNLMSGVFSITFAMNGFYKIASLLIFLSAFLDLFDGRLARKLKVTNQVGVELDSLADVVSFGVAPAILFHTMAEPGFLTNLAFVMYPTMGALRLARFNVKPTVGYFVGVPITFAGLTMSLMMLFSFSNGLIPILLALLMVSPFRVMKF
ncbi:CDP-diacylglycerol--serine O-phosphatidyltransferase [Ammoniphilus oxalaticus]|uniref:CDP-diacylglycerol--serine O-phosphatidyltransferase n=1 Tax=Ammoniphilus oxalaticus TaxID=66863 RepID=A0A419SJ40_9BACL|nr:CDP-diacylglycerol--serine O-phosphatidyltransferase [Ammoniphilus oxalaticus]RKD24041.1 CDP-diacylglycerol--serine O-phosphatidyltransferase [Ammoniphilus oxalaticus]